MDMSFFFIEELREMETDFGIIPYPKYDENQSSYATRLCYYMPTVVPITIKGERLDRAGVMLEALACEYASNVVPAYYEIALKPWDYAAGVLIAQEAGAFISDVHGAPIEFSNNSVVAANSQIHAQILRTLNPV